MVKHRSVLQKPETSNSAAQREIDNAEKQFDAFHENVKEMTLDRMNQAPKEESESHVKLSSKEISNSKEIYLKPKRSFPAKEKFNEAHRKDYEFKKEYVNFIAENREIGGENIDLWTKPFPGVPAEEWDVPVNKPVWGPRYLADRIKECSYHRFVMEQNKIMGADGMGQYYGSMAVDTTVQRLDAHPVNQRKSVFMGASNF